jgi:hypothetical protein
VPRRPALEISVAHCDPEKIEPDVPLPKHFSHIELRNFPFESTYAAEPVPLHDRQFEKARPVGEFANTSSRRFCSSAIFIKDRRSWSCISADEGSDPTGWAGTEDSRVTRFSEGTNAYARRTAVIVATNNSTFWVRDNEPNRMYSFLVLDLDLHSIDESKRVSFVVDEAETFSVVSGDERWGL